MTTSWNSTAAFGGANSLMCTTHVKIYPYMGSGRDQISQTSNEHKGNYETQYFIYPTTQTTTLSILARSAGGEMQTD